MKFILALALFMSVASAQEAGLIKDFNYKVSDIAEKGLKKEVLFKRMERSMIDLEKSICANRAHMWAYDFYRWYGINTGKIFLFFGESIWTDDAHGYMYHVSPYIVENGQEYMMEASYGDVSRPLNIKEWIENETYNRVKGEDCVELTVEDKDMTEYFYDRYNLPEDRGAGKKSARCYYRKVPGYYWFPTSIAYHDLKKDEDGDRINFDPKSFDVDDVLDACIEAASSKFGRFFGGGKAKCKKHLGL